MIRWGMAGACRLRVWTVADGSDAVARGNGDVLMACRVVTLRMECRFRRDVPVCASILCDCPESGGFQGGRWGSGCG
ncbi:MAG: hypothetical protein KIG22_01980, partial [Oxalobacter sp.]|nr:hypothetical protein [Oxalobacter sp.]